MGRKLDAGQVSLLREFYEDAASYREAAVAMLISKAVVQKYFTRWREEERRIGALTRPAKKRGRRPG